VCAATDSETDFSTLAKKLTGALASELASNDDGTYKKLESWWVDVPPCMLHASVTAFDERRALCQAVHACGVIGNVHACALCFYYCQLGQQAIVKTHLIQHFPVFLACRLAGNDEEHTNHASSNHSSSGTGAKLMSAAADHFGVPSNVSDAVHSVQSW
jgi:hypothetical protein